MNEAWVRGSHRIAIGATTDNNWIYTQFETYSYSTIGPASTNSTTIIKSPILHIDRHYAIPLYIITIKHGNHYSTVE